MSLSKVSLNHWMLCPNGHPKVIFMHSTRPLTEVISPPNFPEIVWQSVQPFSSCAEIATQAEMKLAIYLKGQNRIAHASSHTYIPLSAPLDSMLG